MSTFFSVAAQIDKELSDSAKMEHNGEDSPQVQSKKKMIKKKKKDLTFFILQVRPEQDWDWRLF